MLQRKNAVKTYIKERKINEKLISNLAVITTKLNLQIFIHFILFKLHIYPPDLPKSVRGVVGLVRATQLPKIVSRDVKILLPG